MSEKELEINRAFGWIVVRQKGRGQDTTVQKNGIPQKLVRTCWVQDDRRFDFQ